METRRSISKAIVAALIATVRCARQAHQRPSAASKEASWAFVPDLLKWASILALDRSSDAGFQPRVLRNGVWKNGWWGPALLAGVVGRLRRVLSYRPTYDGAGNYLGYSYVDVCS